MLGREERSGPVPMPAAKAFKGSLLWAKGINSSLLFF
jgi:hypothetical protein